jgi:hypothetical protein
LSCPETETGVQPRSGVVRQVLVRDAIHEPVDKGNAIDRFCEAPVVLTDRLGRAFQRLGLERRARTVEEQSLAEIIAEDSNADD